MGPPVTGSALAPYGARRADLPLRFRRVPEAFRRERVALSRHRTLAARRSEPRRDEAWPGAARSRRQGAGGAKALASVRGFRETHAPGIRRHARAGRGHGRARRRCCRIAGGRKRPISTASSCWWSRPTPPFVRRRARRRVRCPTSLRTLLPGAVRRASAGAAARGPDGAASRRRARAGDGDGASSIAWRSSTTAMTAFSPSTAERTHSQSRHPRSFAAGWRHRRHRPHALRLPADRRTDAAV